MSLDAGAIPEALPGNVARADFNTMRGIVNPSFPLQEVDLGNLQVTTAKIALLAVTVARLAADAVETAKIKNLNVTPGKASLGFGRYVPRETNGWDWRESDLTLDGAWHNDGINCPTEAGVPAGAVAITIGGTIKNDVIDTKLRLRQNATTGNTEFSWWVLVANLYMPYFYSIIPCDADRKFDYNISAGIDYMGMVVTGWFI